MLPTPPKRVHKAEPFVERVCFACQLRTSLSDSGVCSPPHRGELGRAIVCLRVSLPAGGTCEFFLSSRTRAFRRGLVVAAAGSAPHPSLGLGGKLLITHTQHTRTDSCISPNPARVPSERKKQPALWCAFTEPSRLWSVFGLGQRRTSHFWLGRLFATHGQSSLGRRAYACDDSRIFFLSSARSSTPRVRVRVR